MLAFVSQRSCRLQLLGSPLKDCHHKDRPAKPTANARAEFQIRLHGQKGNGCPKDNFQGIEYKVGFVAVVLSQARDMFSTQLVQDDDERLGALVAC